MRRFIFTCLLALGTFLLPARATCQGMPVYDNTNFITRWVSKFIEAC